MVDAGSNGYGDSTFGHGGIGAGDWLGDYIGLIYFI